MTRRPLASLSIDLDNQWAYMKAHGDDGWESFSTYLPLVVPRIIDAMNSFQLPLTVFVVGQDAVQAENRPSLQRLAAAGFEMANHSFHHEPWLHLLSREQLHHELEQTERAVFQVTGQRVVGFRGPGFSTSPLVRDVLAERGYRYDASAFPTFIGPIARMYFMLTARLSREEKQKRRALYGTWRAGFQPLRPYSVATGHGPLLQIPVTTMPLVRLPIHLSYVMYLARWSSRLALAYFRTALRLCRWRRIPPSILLHPLDFLGCDDQVGLEYFPAMDLLVKRKQTVLESAFQVLREQFQVVTMCQQAEAAEPALRLLPPAAVARDQQDRSETVDCVPVPVRCDSSCD